MGRIHVVRSPDNSNVKEYVVQCVRDRFTGLFAAYPAKDRSTESIVSDAADDFESAAKILGWIPTPSLPSRFPRNS